jgi:nicotinate phosphoribosyltransferase
MQRVMENGKAVVRSSAHESARYAKERLDRLAVEHKRFEFPHIYKVGISSKLLGLRTRLVEEFQQQSR